MERWQPYSARTPRRRPHSAPARSGRGREAEPGDAVARTLTLQLAFCLVIAVSAAIFRLQDGAGFAAFAGRYRQIMGQEQSASQMMEEAIDVLADAAAWLRGQDHIPGASAVMEEEPFVSGGSSLADLTGEELGAGGGFHPAEPDSLPPGYALASPVFLTAPMYNPISGVVSSLYGYREHPVTQAADFHTGVDVAAAAGSEISASLGGVVEEVGYSEIYGNYLTILHSEGLRTRYCHCQQVLVSEGQTVRRGEVVALVGSTGVSTGPHLHFELKIGEQYADPLWVLRWEERD